MKVTWREAIHDQKFLGMFGLTCLSLLILIPFAPWFFGEIIGPKPGLNLNDWLLNQLPPTDWSLWIFITIYSTVAVTLLLHIKDPRFMFVGLATYSGVTWLRMLTIYLFTLEPPSGIIYLTDPFLFLAIYPQDNFAKDLFFSGHVSTMTVMVLVEPIKKFKRVKILAAAVVSLLILLQHVHYSIDVVFAPVLTYLIYRLVTQIKTPQKG